MIMQIGSGSLVPVEIEFDRMMVYSNLYYGFIEEESLQIIKILDINRFVKIKRWWPNEKTKLNFLFDSCI